jgi:hypothetical protein
MRQEHKLLVKWVSIKIEYVNVVIVNIHHTHWVLLTAHNSLLHSRYSCVLNMARPRSQLMAVFRSNNSYLLAFLDPLAADCRKRHHCMMIYFRISSDAVCQAEICVHFLCYKREYFTFWFGLIALIETAVCILRFWKASLQVSLG